MMDDFTIGEDFKIIIDPLVRSLFVINGAVDEHGRPYRFLLTRIELEFYRDRFVLIIYQPCFISGN